MSGIPDYPLEETIDFKFTSRSFSTGVPTVLAGSPVVVIYEDNGTTEITAAETLTVDFDTIVGLNNLRVVATAANGFEAGKSYSAVLSAGTVGGVSVAGEVVVQFSIERSPVNWANVTAPTTAVDLTATDIQLCDTITTYTGNTPQTGDSYVAIGTDGTGLTEAGGTGDHLTAINLPNQTMDITGNITGNLSGSVGSVVGHTPQTADHTAAIADIPTVAEFNARTLAAASYFDPAADTVANVTLVATLTTYTGNTPQTADHTAAIADIPTVAEFNARTLASASYFDPAADTVANVTTVATLTGHTAQTADHTAAIADIPTVAEFNARTLLAASYFDPAADTVANVTTVATTTTNSDMRGTDSAALATALATAQSDLDIITGATGVNLLAATQASIDAIEGDTTTDIPALISIAQADLDIITGADGVNLLSATQTSIDNIEGDTNELQGDWVEAGRLDAILDARMAEASISTTGGAVDTVTTLTNHTAQTGDTFALANGAAGFVAIDTVVDAIKAITDAIGATAAANLARTLSTAGTTPGTVDTITNAHTPTTTEFQADDITEATADHYNGRIVIFLTGALAGQATDITDYEAVGGIGQFTVTALTEAASNNDTFVVV